MHKHTQGNGNVDDTAVYMNNMLSVKDSVVQDFNDAVTHAKANGRSRQTGCV